MLVRVSQEAIQLTVKGVGLAVPDFASAASRLVGHTRCLLPIAHLLHPTVVGMGRQQAGLRIQQGVAVLSNIPVAEAYEPDKVVAAVSAALGIGRSLALLLILLLIMKHHDGRSIYSS